MTPFTGHDSPESFWEYDKNVKSTARVLLVLFGAAIVSAQQQTPDTVTDISAISVERHGWFPGPLKYSLTLRRQGNSTYLGKLVPWKGLYTATVAASDFDRLAKGISDVRFFDLPDVIGPSLIDGEQLIVTVATARKSKTVTTYNLIKSPIAALVALADSVADQLPWVQVAGAQQTGNSAELRSSESLPETQQRFSVCTTDFIR